MEVHEHLLAKLLGVQHEADEAGRAILSSRIIQKKRQETSWWRQGRWSWGGGPRAQPPSGCPPLSPPQRTGRPPEARGRSGRSLHGAHIRRSQKEFTQSVRRSQRSESVGEANGKLTRGRFDDVGSALVLGYRLLQVAPILDLGLQAPLTS